MMANDELLLAISEMLDKKINPIEKSMNSLEKDLRNEIKLVRNEMKIGLQEVKEEVNHVKEEVNHVKEEVHIINLKLENCIEPRLNQIESCYLDTYKRYENGTDKIEKLELDNQIIRSRIQTHDEIFRRNNIA